MFRAKTKTPRGEMGKRQPGSALGNCFCICHQKHDPMNAKLDKWITNQKAFLGAAKERRKWKDHPPDWDI